MRIQQIMRYPVKSMGGHTLEHTTLTTQGIPGDRCWALKDEQRGGIKGGKRFAALMGMHAELREEPTAEQPSPCAHITLPDGQTIASDDQQVNQTLSQTLGAPVSLWPLLPKEQLAHYLRPPPEPGTDVESSLRETFARTEDEPLPDLSVFPEELFTYESPPGTYFDAFPLLLMTTSSLAAISAHREESNFDIRRFRPNIILDTDNIGFIENNWQQRQAQLGEAVLQLEVRCPRCIMTTHGFDNLPKDPGIMRALVQANGGDLGLYASVVSPGTIRVGDELIIDA